MTRVGPATPAASRGHGRHDTAETERPSRARVGPHGRTPRDPPRRSSPPPGGAEAASRRGSPGRTCRTPACPGLGIASTRATQRRLPGWAGTPLRTRRPPIRSIAVNTGSRGSSALAPATTMIRAPAAMRVLDGSADRRGLGIGICETRQGGSEPVELLAEDRLESLAGPEREAARRDRAHGLLLEGSHRHAPPAPTESLLDLADHALGNDQRRDLGATDHLAGIDHLTVEQRVDRHPLETVHRGE